MDRLRSSSTPIQDWIFFSCVVKKPVYRYEIYAVNLGRSTSTSTSTGVFGVLKPKVIFNSWNRWVVCVAGCTLYLLSKDGKVGAIDLSLLLSEDSEPMVLEEEAIPYIASMNHPKGSLEAIPTPGGKVIAFCTHIEFGGLYSSSCIFEVYNPATGCWEDIPPIHQHLPHIRCYMGLNIRSYTFCDDSTLVIELANTGQRFLLSLGDPVCGSRWHDPRSVGEPYPFVGFSHGIVGGGYELCLNDTLVWDINNAGGVNKAVACFPIFQNDDPSFKTKSRMIISGERASCCYVLEITKQQNQHYYLRIEEYQLNLAEYFDDKKGREDKYYEDIQKLAASGSKYQKLVNRMMVTSHRLGWCRGRSTTFTFPLGTSPRLAEIKTCRH